MIGKRIGHYQILEKIGSGGMGEVWLAEDSRLERQVALKFLPYHVAQDEAERTRFVQEAKTAAKLKHQSVAQVYEIGEEDHAVFIVMEYLEGGSLRDRLIHTRGRSLPLEEILVWMEQTAEGLAEAHRQGIVHRDIKPDNLMLTRWGQIRITDFGLARLDSTTRLTASGATLGTINYMSPEQVVGNEVDGRTDLFSLGATFYELLTGSSPFMGPDASAIYYSILHDEPDPVYRFRRDIDQSLEQIITKLLQKDPALRYQHADDVAADLRRLIGTQTVVYHRGRAKRWASFHRRSRAVKHFRYRILTMAAVILGMIGIGYLGFRLASVVDNPEPHAPLPAGAVSDSSGVSSDLQEFLVLQSEALNQALSDYREMSRLNSRLDSLESLLSRERSAARDRETRQQQVPDALSDQELQRLLAERDSLRSMLETGSQRGGTAASTDAVSGIVGDIQILSPLPETTVQNGPIDIRTRVSPKTKVAGLYIYLDGILQVQVPIGTDSTFITTQQIRIETPGRHLVSVLVEDEFGNRTAKPRFINAALPSGVTSVAVLDLEPTNIDPTAAKVISERLRTWLARERSFTVIERGNVESILAELGFQLSGATDTDECVVQVGQLLGVSKIVTGSVVRTGSIYSIQARLIDVVTASVEKQSFYDSASLEDLLLTAVHAVARDLSTMAEEIPVVPGRLPIGRVRITSRPSGADVTVDGVEKGGTPISVSMPIGRHHVEVRKAGYRSHLESLEVTEGRERLINVSLQEIRVQTPLALLGFYLGDVQIKGANTDLWTKATLKQPLYEGDVIRTSSESRAELSIVGDGMIVRIDEDCVFMINPGNLDSLKTGRLLPNRIPPRDVHRGGRGDRGTLGSEV